MMLDRLALIVRRHPHFPSRMLSSILRNRRPTSILFFMGLLVPSVVLALLLAASAPVRVTASQSGPAPQLSRSDAAGETRASGAHPGLGPARTGVAAAR